VYWFVYANVDFSQIEHFDSQKSQTNLEAIQEFA
jgi:hypothetical protein